MTDKEKEATISKAYHDPAGYGSINNTLRDAQAIDKTINCLLYTSPSPRDRQKSRMPSSA